ncbi:MAG: adenine deaminase [Methanobacteriaceae archaeon]|nr:adenine deaminase [Methanobacteriaceae archaeon]
MIIKGNILNVFTDEIYPAEVKINKGIIESVKEVNGEFDSLIVPGFIDSHIHIESSMLTPSRFAELALKQGTTSVVADPHEIANVMGVEGIEYMINDSHKSPLNYFFTVPSCVPSTKFETSGATIDSKIIDDFLSQDEFVALGEVMNYEDVINKNPEIMAKIDIAKKYNKPIDGHAPLLSGSRLEQYIKTGISTDHECSTPQEVMEKKRAGMKIMIREGSFSSDIDHFMYNNGDIIVNDDISAYDLLNRGHMNHCLRKAVDLGLDPFKAIRMVTLNPAQHYNLNRGSISVGKAADLVFIDNLTNFNVNKVIINGNVIYKKEKLLYKANPSPIRNTIFANQKVPEDFNVCTKDPKSKCAIVNVINYKKDPLITQKTTAKLNVNNGVVIPSVYNDILKISNIERYNGNTISNGFIKGFGIKNGAIASTVSHDSHNIIVVGTNNDYMTQAVNFLIKNKGGLVAISNQGHAELTLPIAGLMSDKSPYNIIKSSEYLNKFIKNMGCNLESPFMVLSFAALLVIPELKMSNQGLFDVNQNKFIDVIEKEI